MKTLWRWPPDNWVTMAERCSHRLTRSKQSWTIFLSSLPGRRNHPMVLTRPIITTS